MGGGLSYFFVLARGLMFMDESLKREQGNSPINLGGGVTGF